MNNKQSLKLRNKRVGKMWGVPYDFRRPTINSIKNRVWNKKDKRIVTPKVFGWGWTINFYQIFKKFGLFK